jgi:hypothetical protein
MRLYPIVHSLLYQRGEFLHLKDRVPQLRAAGIEVVVCCCRRGDPELRGVVEYVHRPFSDGRTNDMDAIHDTAALVAQAMQNARPVLVHCAAGVNRSGLISALAVREFTGCSGAEAIARVRRGRPGALTNPYFCEYLAGLPAEASAAVR